MKDHDSFAAARAHMWLACLVATPVLATGLLAALLLFDTGSAWAQEEEKVDPAKISMGRNVFRSWCRSCHGEAGKGDGPMAASLTVPPADLTLIRQRNSGYFYFERVAEKIDGRVKVRGHGSKDMPVWGEAFKALDENADEKAIRDKILTVVHYLRSIQAADEKTQ